MDLDMHNAKSLMTAISDLNGYSTVWIPGSPSSFLLKTASSQPRLICLKQEDIITLVPINTPVCKGGYAFIHEKGSTSLVGDMPSHMIRET